MSTTDSSTGQDPGHLDQTALAARWNISPKTLERWRVLGIGPVFLKLGGQVRYRREDVEAFERHALRKSTAEPGSPPDTR